MADHPGIGVGPNDIPFLLGSRIPVWDVVRVVEMRNGTASEAANFLGIGQPGVDAALAYWKSLPPEVRQSIRKASEAEPHSKADSKSLPERIAQVFALLAGLTTIVYITGGLVLVTRLALADLPVQPVVAQLPREFLIGVGVSQVLLPALVVAIVYGGWRLLQRPDAPKQRPWAYKKTNGGPTRKKNQWRFVKVGLLITVPMFFALAGTLWEEDLEGETAELFGGNELMLEPALLVLAGMLALVSGGIAAEIRGRQAQERHENWHSLSSSLKMTGLYSALSVPVAIVVFSSLLPLNEAKLCTTQGFEEYGDLIGQSGDGVYLGERPSPEAQRLGQTEKRISVFPNSQVEELFIGPHSDRAQCDPRGAQGVVEASLRRTEVSKAADSARAAASEVAQATNLDDAVDAAERVEEATLAAVNGTRAAANVAARTLRGRARMLRVAASLALRKAGRLGRLVRRINEGSAGPAAQTELERRAVRAAGAAEHAELKTRQAVRALLRTAKRTAEE